jgi:ATP-binding cassette subfamily B protein
VTAASPPPGRPLGPDALRLLAPRLMAQVFGGCAWLLLGWAVLQVPWTQHALAAPALLAASAWLARAAVRDRELLMLTTWCAGLRLRLLQATLDSAAQDARPLHAMSVALEVEALTPQSLSDAWDALFAALRIVGLAAAMLALGAPLQATCLLLAGALAGAWLCCHARHLRRETDSRLVQTTLLAEHLEAQRTRVVQQAPGLWHRHEDPALAQALRDGARVDASTLRGTALLPHGYLLLSFVGLGPTLISNEPVTLPQVVVCGLALLAADALASLGRASLAGSQAWIAWRLAIRTIAARPAVVGGVPVNCAPTQRMPPDEANAPLLVARGLRLQRPGAVQALWREVDLEVRAGERVLLEGAAGSGKSSLAAVLAGLGPPDAGVVLLRGLDRRALGDAAWRRTVALAVAHDDNHLLAATLATNLLLGRPLPHSPQDHEDAWRLCAELGLDALLRRMPEGMNQRVGETGWRLSQGEAGRVFLARALLQRAELVILDQSFAGLDPHTLARCVQCARRHAPTLIVIATP